MCPWEAANQHRAPSPPRPPPGSVGWGQATGRLEQTWKGSGLAAGSGDPSATLLVSPELWSRGGDPVGDRPAVTPTRAQVRLQVSLTSVLGPQMPGEPELLLVSPGSQGTCLSPHERCLDGPSCGPCLMPGGSERRGLCLGHLRCWPRDPRLSRPLSSSPHQPAGAISFRAFF